MISGILVGFFANNFRIGLAISFLIGALIGYMQHLNRIEAAERLGIIPAPLIQTFAIAIVTTMLFFAIAFGARLKLRNRK